MRNRKCTVTTLQILRSRPLRPQSIIIEKPAAVSKRHVFLLVKHIFFFFLFDIKSTDISSEHFLRTCSQVQRNVRKSDVVYACKKKKGDQSDRVWQLCSGAFITPVPPMCPTFGSCQKGSSHKFAVFFFFFFFFVNVMHF